MRKVKNYQFGLLIVSFLLGSFSLAKAADYKEIPITEKQNSKQFSKQKAKILKLVKKLFLQKKTKRDDDSIIKRAAKIALILGIAAAATMLLAIVLGSGGWLALPYLLSIPALIFSFRALSKIGKSENRATYEKEKKQAKIGMWFTILTVALPLIVVIILLIVWV
jgi:uncharacterized membrane protein